MKVDLEFQITTAAERKSGRVRVKASDILPSSACEYIARRLVRRMAERCEKIDRVLPIDRRR